MGYLEKWKAAKKKFESLTGQDKPAEKGSILGIAYRKSSGIEDALKTLDKALAKKVPSEAKDALAGYKSAVEKYIPTLEKGAKAADDKVQKETLKLLSDLNSYHSDAAQEVKDLATDPKAIVTLAEAIGPKAVSAFNGCALFSNSDLSKWLSDGSTSMVKINGKLLKDPDSAKLQATAKKAYNTLKKEYDAFKGKLNKTGERAKCIAEAKKFHSAFEGSYHAMASDSSIQACIGMWSSEAQSEPFKEAKKKGEIPDAMAAYNEWVSASPAWAAAQRLINAWSNADTFLSTFHGEIG